MSRKYPMESIHFDITQLALGLDVSQSSRNVCPFCKAKHELSFKITRTDQGIVYKCYRASCNARGFISSIPGTTAVDKSTYKTTFKPRVYRGETEVLPQDILEFLEESYGLTKTDCTTNGIKYDRATHRIVFPLFDYRGDAYGHATKRLPGSSYPLKAVTYRDRETTGLHYPPSNQSGSGAIALVEDVLSSIKLSKIIKTACLLGTELLPAQVQELRKQTDTIIMMLDPDAIKKSLYYYKNYGFFFRNFYIIQLSKDPKDTDYADLKAHLEGKLL